MDAWNAGPDADGWVEWIGGDYAPLTGTVEIRMKSGDVAIGPAEKWRWSWGHNAGDIVAYRVVK